MATVYVLGPAIESVVEPEPEVEPVAPAMVGRIGIKFTDADPTKPGGIVNIQLLAAVNPTDIRPTHVHAIYVNPPESVPAADTRTAEWFMSSGQPLGTIPIPPPPADASMVFTINVPGVKPGIHFVQTVMEYEQ